MSQSSTHLDKFAEANANFWATQAYPKAEGKTIFVDIMHDNQWYVRWNLQTAKYLQKIYGGRIVALQHHWETPTVSYDAELNAVLAASYGVDEIIDLDMRLETLKSHLTVEEQAMLDEFDVQLLYLKGLEGGTLRQALQTMEGGGNPDFGWLAYDTYIRTKRISTIYKLDDEIIEAYRSYLLWLLLVRRLASNRNLFRCVLGHIEYAPYAFFAHEAIDAGGEAYFMWPLVPGTLRAFRDRASLRQNRDANYVDFFKKEIIDNIRPDHPRVEEFWRGFREKFAATRSYQRDNQQDESALSREEFLAIYELQDVRTVCLMSQALSDAVHSNGPMVFDDFGRWIWETFERCENRDDVNVLVKVHPRDRVYSRDQFIPDLIRRFDSAKNLRVLPRTVENSDIVANCDAIVTVHGTPGYELPLLGAESIIAGQSRYSGLGICNEPKTKEEYFDAITGVRPQPLSKEEARERALLFAFAEFTVFKSPCLFIRTDKVRMPANSPFWLEERQRVLTMNVEDDPYFWAMLDLCRNRRTHLLRKHYIPQQRVAAPAPRVVRDATSHASGHASVAAG